MIFKQKSLFVAVVFMTLLFSSCTVEPQPIQYGNAHCQHCDMTVVDKSHSSEYVTKKGKAYFFDAIECLVNKINQEKNESDMAFILVADYTNPGVLLNAVDAHFVISEAIKSPMGANLSAFSNKDTANKTISMNGGKVYNWNELKLHLKN